MQTVSYIANEFSRMQNARLRLRLDIAQVHSQDALGMPLPQHVETYHNYVEYCAACLTLTRRAGELAELLVELTAQPQQRTLWN